jgi:hypothetical protein
MEGKLGKRRLLRAVRHAARAVFARFLQLSLQPARCDLRNKKYE